MLIVSTAASATPFSNFIEAPLCESFPQQTSFSPDLFRPVENNARPCDTAAL
jgi:hypothetical protein